MKTLRLKLISLIAMVCLVLGLVVVGIYAAEIQYIKLGGNITFSVDDKSLYVQDVRVQEDMQSNPYSLKEQGIFIPGYINGEFNMNIGSFTNNYGGFSLYFDIINTVDESGNSYVYDVTATTGQTADGVEVQVVVDNKDNHIPPGAITPSDIDNTTLPTATVILTVTSPQGIEVDLSQITITITMIEIVDFEFLLNDTDYTASVTGYTGSDTTVTIPSSISVVETTDGETKYYEGSQYTVTSIADGYPGVFQENTTITNVVFPDTLQTIGYDAFRYCNNIETIEYQGTLEEYLSIDMGNVWITDSSHSLKIGGQEITNNLVIPDTITTIPKYAFHGCTDIVSVSIPESVTSIGEYAFQFCSQLTSVDFGENSQLTSIGYSAFYSCTSLTKITIPSSVTSIGEYVFRSCSQLTSVDFGDNSQLASIGRYAFDNTSLTSITIPSSVKSIENFAFQFCSQLISVDFGDNSQLTSIGSWAFLSCALTAITIPASVISIGTSAFNGCDLTTVTIENETIYNNATSSTDCGCLLDYATTVRVLTDFVSDSHSYINTTNFPYTNDEVVGEKTYRVYSTEPLS